MNKILFVVACEGNYQGLHGINEYQFSKLAPDDDFRGLDNDVRGIGDDMIWGLIDSYDIGEGDEEEREIAYENGQYWGYYFETDMTAEQLQEIYENEYCFDDFDEFVKKFGGKEVE